MGRRGGMRSSSPRSGPTRSAKTMAAPRPAPQSNPTQSGGGMMSGLGSTLMQGMAFGAGSEVAHQAVRGIMGSGGHHDTKEIPQTQSDPCFQQNQDFMNCLQFNKNDVGLCQNYLDLFKQCKGQY